MDDITLEFMDNKTKSMVIAAMKKSWRLYSIDRQQALKRAEVLGVGPRGGKRYECKLCKGLFASNLIDVDHIEPFIPLDSNSAQIGLKILYKRLFCSVDNLAILCKDCHDKKSFDESQVRKHHRRLNKPTKVKSVKPLKVAS